MAEAERLAAASGSWADLVSEASELTTELTDAPLASKWWTRLGVWYGLKLDRADYALPSLRRALGLQAKAELDKVYRTDSDYDLDVTAAGASADHAAKLAALPHVTVGDLTVGYEQVSTLSTSGVGRSRHFRATWRRGDRDVIVGYQTSEALDVVAFAKLLDKLVPSVERALE